jgi:hypothetical protein
MVHSGVRALLSNLIFSSVKNDAGGWWVKEKLTKLISNLYNQNGKVMNHTSR